MLEDMSVGVMDLRNVTFKVESPHRDTGLKPVCAPPASRFSFSFLVPGHPGNRQLHPRPAAHHHWKPGRLQRAHPAAGDHVRRAAAGDPERHAAEGAAGALQRRHQRAANAG